MTLDCPHCGKPVVSKEVSPFGEQCTCSQCAARLRFDYDYSYDGPSFWLVDDDECLPQHPAAIAPIEDWRLLTPGPIFPVVTHIDFDEAGFKGALETVWLGPAPKEMCKVLGLPLLVLDLLLQRDGYRVVSERDWLALSAKVGS